MARIAFAGKRWESDITIKPFTIASKCDTDSQLRYFRRWVAENLDEGYFRITDIAWNKSNKCDRDTTTEASVTMTVPAIVATDPAKLYPSTTTFPSETTFPSGLPNGVASIDAFVFTLTASLVKPQGELVLSEDTSVGRTLPVNGLSQGSLTITNDNPWDTVNDGIYEQYENYYKAGIAELHREMNLNSLSQIIREGDYVQIEEQLFMVTKDFAQGDTEIKITPPNRHPRKKGTLVNTDNPTCVMAMTGDVSFSASNGRYDSIVIKATEIIE